MSVRDSVSPMMRYGGKARAAPLVWEALGNPACFVDPFAGTLAVPLRSPQPLKKVVINDLDDMVTNFWRSIQHDPEAVAYWADYPTMHTDLIARREWLRQEWPRVRRTMKIDPFWYDAQVAGWWVWAVCNSIDLLRLDYPSEASQEWYANALSEARSKAGASNGFSTIMPCVSREAGGKGVSAQRFAGVAAQHPEPPDQRMPNVAMDNTGKGVAAQRQGQMTSKYPEPPDQRMPHVAVDNIGVGVAAQRKGDMNFKHPPVGAPTENGHVALPPDRLFPEDCRPFTGERLTPWLMDLAKKIQRWIILCKDWRDVVGSRCVTSTTPSQSNIICGIFLDPPYNRNSVVRSQLYSQDDFDVADEVFDWLRTYDKRYGCSPWENPQLRIILCGYGSDYRASELPDARIVPWGRGGGMERMRGGGDETEDGGSSNPRQEILILSPACLPVTGEMLPSGEYIEPPRPKYAQPVLL